jgi:hypothetical protein
MRAIRARIDLRNKIGREPSACEVQTYMRHEFADKVTYREVSAAFRSGKEVRQTLGFLRDSKLQRVSRNWSWRLYSAWSMIPTLQRRSRGQCRENMTCEACSVG